MARKRRTAAPASLPAVTANRAARLYRFVALVGQGTLTRAVLMRRLKLDQRAFYRELELLRRIGIEVTIDKNRYRLTESVEEARKRLPLPNPQLTLGEAQQLCKGRTAAHRKLKMQIDALDKS